MNKVKETIRRRPAKSRRGSRGSQKHQPEFKPHLNGLHRIRFDSAHSGDGFKILLKGGMFHRFPEGFVVTNLHMDLLKKAKIPYDIIKT